MLSSPNPRVLAVTMSFSLDDLLISAPALKKLAKYGRGQALKPEDAQRLQGYLAEHFQLQQDQQPLVANMTFAGIAEGYNSHVGAYSLVKVNYDVELYRDGEVFPLRLGYDAILHEIRSHRVNVLWQQAADNTKSLIHFGYHKDGESPRTYLLQGP